MKDYKVEKRRKDKSDRATVDKVLDGRTLRILEKLQSRNKLINLRGSLCTGKESNVYLAEASTGLHSKFIRSKYESNGEESEERMTPVAVKIFKTSIMPFRDRERYIRSEKRFQKFCTSNPRKLIKLWAEKEVRNLKRLNNAGIASPEPVYLKSNILIMTLIGSYDNVAPRLRDSEIMDDDDCYLQCVNIMRSMYNDAGLVHADLSEFNLLYLDGVVYVIDVGQSVEIDHENAQRFLISDITNINNFFIKRGVGITSGNDLFELITGHSIPLYLKDIGINKDSFVPFRVSEVGNNEDLEMFEGNKENIESYEAGSDDSEFSLESVDDGKEEKRRKKKLVKESNKIRRASRISKKEKKKIFKKYIGKSSRK